MAKLNFYLNNKGDNEGNRNILLYFSFNGIRVPVSTNETIKEKAWNANTQRVRTSYSASKSINDRLDDIAEKVKKMFRADFREVAPRKEVVKEKIQLIINPLEEIGSKDFISFAEQFEKNSNRKKETKKNYVQSINHLKAYKSQSNQFKKRPLTFNDIDLNFYNEFYGYLEQKVGLAKNSIGTHIKVIKVFMKEAFERNLHTNVSFKLSGFKVVTEETDAPFLNAEELKKIYELDLSGSAKYDRIRDLFLIGCWTGLRYSDWSQVHKGNVYNNDYLRLKTIKGDRVVVIPLHRYVRKILEKYNYDLPPVISNQKLNDYLKEISKLAGIDDNVSNSMTKAGVRVSNTFEKWEKVSTHTARRSFATNMYIMNVPSLTIMAITGHKTEKAFLRYIKVSPEQHASKLLKIWNEQDAPQLKAV
jgi:integrase